MWKQVDEQTVRDRGNMDESVRKLLTSFKGKVIIPRTRVVVTVVR